MPDCKQFLLSFTLLTTSSIAIGQSNHNFHFDSGYAAVNGTKLYYEVAGTGQPLILIHGSFGDRRFWDLQFAELSKKCKVSFLQES